MPYVEWREECLFLVDAYQRWLNEADRDRRLAFAAYRAALDREQQAPPWRRTRSATGRGSGAVPWCPSAGPVGEFSDRQVGDQPLTRGSGGQSMGPRPRRVAPERSEMRAPWIKQAKGQPPPGERLATFRRAGPGFVLHLHLTVPPQPLESAGAADDLPGAGLRSTLWHTWGDADSQAAVGAVKGSVHQPDVGVVRVQVAERAARAKGRVAEGGSARTSPSLIDFPGRGPPSGMSMTTPVLITISWLPSRIPVIPAAAADAETDRQDAD